MAHTQGNQSVYLRSGHVANFDVFVYEGTVTVLQEDGQQVCKHKIPSLSRLTGPVIIKRLRYWETPDFRIIGLITEVGEDYFFGYALNLDDPSMSEWGYCP